MSQFTRLDTVSTYSMPMESNYPVRTFLELSVLTVSLISYTASQDWLDNYNQDPNVSDDYAQTNQIEVGLLSHYSVF